MSNAQTQTQTRTQTQTQLEATLVGTGFWSETIPSAADLVEGRELDTASTAPAATLLPGRLRRRASRVTRLSAEVLEQCLAPLGGVKELSVPPRIVSSSSWGEIEITVELLGAIARRELLSPTAFHNSVHNAALGYLSIATANQRPSVAIAAGDAGVAMGALESLTSLVDDGVPCVFIAVEERVPAPFTASGGTHPSLAMSWCLVPRGSPGLSSLPAGVPGSDVTLLRSDRPADSMADLDAETTAAHDDRHFTHAPDLPRWLDGGPLAPMAAVVLAHHRRRAASIDLGAGWHLELSPRP